MSSMIEWFSKPGAQWSRLLPAPALAARGLWLLPLLALMHMADARAAFTMNLYECGNNVVASGSGSFIPGPTISSGAAFQQIQPSLRGLYTGGVPSFNSFSRWAISGPPNFGPGNIAIAPNSNSGTYVNLLDQGLAVATGYVSGTPITSGSVFNNRTLSGIGATVGTYIWTWGSDETADSYTLIITDSSEPAPFPTTFSVSPTSGPSSGGTEITISGCGFTGATAITVGGTACASFTVISDTEATCITPAGNAGEASVLVTTPGGTNAANSLFSYSDPPGPPTAVSVSALDGQATVSFSAPASDGGAAITSYSVICTSNDGGASGNATGASSPIVVSGLTVGKTYTCQVTAINSIGPGTASIASMPFMVQLALPVPLLPQGALMLLALLLGLIAVTTLHRRAC